VGMKWDMIADCPLVLTYLSNDNNTNGFDSNVFLTMGGGTDVDHVAQFEITNNAHLLAIGVNSTTLDSPEAAYMRTYTDSALILGTNDVDRMYIASSGNIGIGTNSPSQLLDVNGTLKANRVLGVAYADIAGAPTGGSSDNSLSNAEFLLREDDMMVSVQVGSVIEYRGTEYLNDTTFIRTGQTVNRDDYIALANKLGIPKSQTTFTIPDHPSSYWQNIINKPTLFQADWNSTIINKPTLFSGNYNDLTNKPTTTLGVVGSYGLFAYFPAEFIEGPEGPNLLPGDTSAGSKLFYANTVNYTYTSAGSGTVYRIGAYNWSPSGTWRLMGQIGYTRDGNPTLINNNFGVILACVSLWVRIS